MSEISNEAVFAAIDAYTEAVGDGWHKPCAKGIRAALLAAAPSAPQGGVTAGDLDVLRRMKAALPDVGINGWWEGVQTLERVIAALTAQPRTDVAQQGEVVARAVVRDGRTAAMEWLSRVPDGRHDLYTAPPSAPVGDSLLQTALRNLPQYISKSGLVGPDKHSAVLCFEVLRDALAQQHAPSAPVGVDALIRLVEGPGCLRWQDGQGFRLKDTPEWVAFYVAAKNALAQQPAACDMGELCIGCEPRNADGSCPDQQPAADSDDAAVDAFATAMKEKLAVARAKGRGGWDDDEPGMQQRLSDMLRAHVEKGDPRDVANFAMFLHQRGEAVLPAQQPAAVDEADGWIVTYHWGSGPQRAVHFDAEKVKELCRASNVSARQFRYLAGQQQENGNG